MTYDFTNKSDREELHGILKKTIEGHRNNIKLELTVNSLKCIERLIETQERIIEDQEERIAIMSEGGWHKITESTESLPKETDSVDVWVYGEDENGNPIVFRAIYSRWHFYDVSGRLVKECKITHWMYNKEPEPPKEGEEHG